MLRILYALLLGAPSNHDCLRCICLVESGCQNPGCGPDGKSDSCGIYQIKLNYYIDCGRPGRKPNEPVEIAWRRCAQDDDCARTCVINYFELYYAGCADLKKSDCEVMARNHNGGPQGCRKRATDVYWNKIMAKGCN